MSYDIERYVKEFDEKFEEFIMPYLEQHGFDSKSREVEESSGSYQFAAGRAKGGLTLHFRFCNHHYDVFDGISISLQSTSADGEPKRTRLNDILGDGSYKRYSQLDLDTSLKEAANDIKTHFGKLIEQ